MVMGSDRACGLGVPPPGSRVGGYAAGRYWQFCQLVPKGRGMVDIVLVEATRTTRESLADLLESQPDLRVVGAPESLSTTAVDASEPISLLVVCADRSDDFDWSVLRDVTGRMGAVRVVFVMADT